MSKRPSLAEVDQLIEELDRAEPEQTGWRPSLERLESALVRAHAARESARQVYIVFCLGVVLCVVIGLFPVWNANRASPEWFVCLLLLNGFQLLGASVLPALHPVLRREDRVAALLAYFGADIPENAEASSNRQAPPEVLAALRALERAKSPTGLGRAYDTVEKWVCATQRFSWDGVALILIWVLAFVAAMPLGRAGVPDFWRGAAFMFVVMVALQRMAALQRKGSIVRRVEDALGRWRHLVPAMREAPP